jgi:bifunctional non-homologous end joining protein LigD
MFEFCLPTTGAKVPDRPDWIHEIKYDGYRLRVERQGDRVRLITRGGYDWTKRFPWIVEAALKNRQKHFVIDGEAVILGVDGYSDFNALHSGKHNEEVQLCAFDVLAMDGDDLRDLPLSMRKANLARLLARRPDGIFVSDFELGEIGPDLFRKACEFGLRDWSRSIAIGPIAPATLGQDQEPQASGVGSCGRILPGMKKPIGKCVYEGCRPPDQAAAAPTTAPRAIPKTRPCPRSWPRADVLPRSRRQRRSIALHGGYIGAFRTTRSDSGIRF